MEPSTLAFEAVLVGVGFTVMSVLVGWGMQWARSGGKPPKLFPKHFGAMVLCTFIAGGALHVLLEVSGVNQSYCEAR